MTTETPTPPKQPPKPDLFGGGKRKIEGPKPENDNLISFFKENSKETVVYVLLILSLLLLFFDSTTMYGGIIIGILFGLYFIDEISGAIKNIQGLIDTYGMMKALVCGAILLALLIKAPFIILGVAIVALFKCVLLPEGNK